MYRDFIWKQRSTAAEKVMQDLMAATTAIKAMDPREVARLKEEKIKAAMDRLRLANLKKVCCYLIQ